jgi:hypothetical protein
MCAVIHTPCCRCLDVVASHGIHKFLNQFAVRISLLAMHIFCEVSVYSLPSGSGDNFFSKFLNGFVVSKQMDT